MDPQILEENVYGDIPENYYVYHKDGDRSNNSKDNLFISNRLGYSKYDKELIEKAIDMWNDGYTSIMNISAETGIPAATLSTIFKSNTLRDTSIKPIKRKTKSQFPDYAKEIVEMLDSNNGKLNILDESEKELLQSRYKDKLTLRKIGDNMGGITKQAVSLKIIDIERKLGYRDDE